MNQLDASVPKLSQYIAMGSSTFVVVALAHWYWLMAVPTVFGLALVTLALARRSRFLLGTGVWWLMAVLVGGIVAGAPIEFALPAAVAILLVWDAGERGMTLVEQLGTRATTHRVEALHAVATVSVGTVSAGIVYVGAGASPVSLPQLSVLLVAASVVAMLYVHDVAP